VLVVGLGLKRFDEAEGIVAAAEVALERVGENASLRSRLLNNWGTCLLARGRTLDAAECFTRAVELDGITHGANHGFVAVSLLHLAEANIAAGRLPEAAIVLDRAWSLCQPDRLAPTPTRLRCQALVGRLRIAEARAADAVGPLERAVLGWERLSGRERALGETLRDLAAARRALGEIALADAAAERAARLLAVAPPRTA
jgi:tetratricopeptide (TPR) repeat protein